MSDDGPPPTAGVDREEEPADDQHDTDDAMSDNDTESTAERLVRVMNYLLLAGLALFALVAAVGVYTAVSSAISTWVTHEFRPLARLGFNLVVLLIAGAGITWQVRRLT